MVREVENLIHIRFQPKNLPNLVKLDISFGNITSLPDSFAEFTKLEELLLSGHKLTSLPNNFSSKGTISLLQLKIRITTFIKNFKS